MQSIVNYINEAKNDSSEKLDALVEKLVSMYKDVQNGLKNDIKCNRFEPGNIVMYVWGNEKNGYEPILYRFDKYNTYTTWSYGSKVKETGYALEAKCTEIKENKGAFIARGAKDMSKVFDEKRRVSAYFPVAVDIEELNAGNIIDKKKLKALADGKAIADLMLSDKKDVKNFDIKNIDSRFFDIKKFDADKYSIAEKFFKPGSIIMTVHTDTKKVCLTELVKFNKGRIPGERMTKNGSLAFADTNIIYPNFSKTEPDSLPDWYDSDMLKTYGARRNYFNNKVNFLIANSLKDLIAGKYLTFEDNEELLKQCNGEYDNEKNAISSKVSEYNEKMKKILAPYTEVKERQKEIGRKTLDKLIKSKPESYDKVVVEWDKAIYKMEMEQITGNKTEYEGKLINTSGGYYARSEKNGNVEELGAPCVPTTRKNIEDMHKMLVEEFNKWKDNGYPKISREEAYFLSPVVVIIANDGNVGITSAGVSVPAAENWYISTNNGKSSMGLMKVQTDKVMIAANITRWPKNLYTFK